MQWWAAALFELRFAAGIAFFAGSPLAAGGSPGRALAAGASFDRVAWATCDPSSRAVLR